MSTSPPKLATFAISHYCERARWALDWHGIDYNEVGWPPGLHRILAKRAGAKKGSVPMLLTDGDVVEGSDTIIDWAEENALKNNTSLCPAQLASVIAEIETRLDKQAGVNVRRFIYAHVFPDNGHFVKPMLFANISFIHRMIGYLMWPKVTKMIVKGYKIDDNAIAESRAVLETEFDWLEEKLERGNGHLAGNTFTRADLTAASLLAPIAKPEEMPLYRNAQFPEELNAVFDEWADRPVMTWVRQIYREHRTASP